MNDPTLHSPAACRLSQSGFAATLWGGLVRLAGLALRRGAARLAVALGLLAASVSGLQAQPVADPRPKWFSADSANFRVHFREGHRAQAEAVARAAERAYPAVTQALSWKPRTRTEIVVFTEFDGANGFATPLPYSYIGVFLSPPDEGELLDNSAWLDLLLVHEFTHAVHLDKVTGAPRVLQSVFGNVPEFIPNIFMPTWGLEGLAILAESDPAAGRGRLRGPVFEAWLRAERERGFVSLRELNADGRRLPVGKQYLYGAYFMDYLRRVHGPQAVGTLVQSYSGNLVPRLHTAPVGATGLTMDVLWERFLADLGRQVDERAAPIKAQPQVLGPALLPATFAIDSLVPHPAGGWLAVASDGVHGTQLVRIGTDGRRTAVMRLNRGARLSTGAAGSVLVMQPDVCNGWYETYDVHRLEGDRLQPWSRCAHLRRAVPAAGRVLALQLDAGATRLVALDTAGAPPRVLWRPPEGHELLDIAASPDGARVALVLRREGDWRVVEWDPAQPQAEPRTLVRRNAPLQGLRWGVSGLELVASDGGVPNVWRLQGGELQRLTHAHTAVLAHAGTAADGSLATAVVAPGGIALHVLPAAVPLQSLAADVPPADAGASAQAPAAAGASPSDPAAALKAERPYRALDALVPRAWLPAINADGGLVSVGAVMNGGDALGWHRYSILAQVELTQKELAGALEYQYAGRHAFALKRELTPRLWTTDAQGAPNDTTVYDRRLRGQWISLFPHERQQRRIVLGVGAALDTVERVDLRNASAARRRDSRLLAGFVEADTSGGDWASEGANRGLRGSLLVESHAPLAGKDPQRYDGTVVRADLRGFVALPLRSVLALRATEARARGRTEPFAVGDATDEWLQFGPVLGDRTLSLRGYASGDPGLSGRNARVLSAEWRVPLTDVDRHFMVPAVGMGRLSAALFADAGGTWDSGTGPAQWRRSVGVELLAETRLLYALQVQVRLGVARALDGPRQTRAYLTAGRAF